MSGGVRAGTAGIARKARMRSMGRSFSLRNRILLFMIAAAAGLILGGPVRAEAASFAALTAGKIYKGYDLTGDKKKDTFKYVKNGTVTLNGKSQKLGSGTANKAYYYFYNAANTFIVVNSKTSSGNTVKIWHYEGGKFKLASEPIGGYRKADLKGVKGNEIFFTTGPEKAADTVSFKKVTGSLFTFTERYALDSKAHRFKRKSRHAKITKPKFYYSGTKTAYRLSTSPSSINKKGPLVSYRDKVKVLYVYFKYSGNDAKKGSKVYQLKVGSKAGWLTEDKARVFLSEMPPFTAAEKYADSLFMPTKVTVRRKNLTSGKWTSRSYTCSYDSDNRINLFSYERTEDGALKVKDDGEDAAVFGADRMLSSHSGYYDDLFYDLDGPEGRNFSFIYDDGSLSRIEASCEDPWSGQISGWSWDYMRKYSDGKLKTLCCEHRENGELVYTVVYTFNKYGLLIGCSYAGGPVQHTETIKYSYSDKGLAKVSYYNAGGELVKEMIVNSLSKTKVTEARFNAVLNNFFVYDDFNMGEPLEYGYGEPLNAFFAADCFF